MIILVEILLLSQEMPSPRGGGYTAQIICTKALHNTGEGESSC